MKKTDKKKLALSKETLKQLDSVRGGLQQGGTADSCQVSCYPITTVPKTIV